MISTVAFLAALFSGGSEPLSADGVQATTPSYSTRPDGDVARIHPSPATSSARSMSLDGGSGWFGVPSLSTRRSSLV